MKMYMKFLFLFYALEYCYDRNCLDLDLPPLLGVISPHLMANHLPIDQAIYEDWCLMCKNSETEEQLLEAVVTFLKAYREQFHFDLDDTIQMVSGFDKDQINIVKEKINEFLMSNNL